MRWWLVEGELTVSAWTYVRAETEEDAIRVARGREGGLAPHGCANDGVGPTEQAVIEECDGAFVPQAARRVSAEEVAAEAGCDEEDL